MTVADSAEKWRPHFCLSIVLRIHQYGIEHFGLISDNSNNGSPHPRSLRKAPCPALRLQLWNPRLIAPVSVSFFLSLCTRSSDNDYASQTRYEINLRKNNNDSAIERVGTCFV